LTGTDELASPAALEAFGELAIVDTAARLNLSGKAEIFSKPTLPR